MKIIDSVVRFIAAWCIGGVVFLWRLTCRSNPVNDHRPQLRIAGKPFVWAMLHSHAINGTIFNDEPCAVTMLSRSKDGDLLVPAFRVSNILPMRGSTRKSHQHDKGGQQALQAMIGYVQKQTASLMIVDGPVGPRNTVHRGVVDLARRANAVIIPVVAIPTRRWVFTRTWDRLQLPKPFSTVNFIMADPIEVEPIHFREEGTHKRHNPLYTRELCARIAEILLRMEAEHDAEEAAICAALKRAKKQAQEPPADQTTPPTANDHTAPPAPTTTPVAPSADSTTAQT